MAPGPSIQILDLRHFAAPVLRPLLETESAMWMERLHWDYRSSSRLLLQYLDGRMLPGYAAVERGQVIGYTFCVYEETKAVIGDVFAVDGGNPDAVDEKGRAFVSARELEATLLRHLLETLLHSPQVDRIESQLLLHTAGTHAAVFEQAGFHIFHRLFMVLPLAGKWSRPHVELPPGLELRTWRDEDLNPAARLIADAYRNHPDSLINDQYRSIYGSLRFLHNIVRYSGCGVFSPLASHVVVERTSRELAALVLGSRVSPQSGHITQICVRPEFRRKGLARMLLSIAASQFMLQGASEVSLTVTAANSEAIDLYRSEGYDCQHTFDAAVWRRTSED